MIALAFVAAGLSAYYLAAPAGESASPSPFNDLVAEFRREIRGDPGRASFTHSGTIAAVPEITELRLPPVNTLTVHGESRGDVAYELTVQAIGTDDQAALERARAGMVSADAFGHVLALQYARQPRSTMALSIRAPRRLAVRLEGVRRATVSAVAGVLLDGLVGDARLTDVAGVVRGTHRSGTLAIAGSAGADLTLIGSRATLEGVTGAIRLNGRGGAVQITEPAGAVEIAAADLDLTLTRPRGPVRLTGTNSQVVVDRPDAAVDVNGEEIELTITLASAVAVTAVTSERPLRLLLDGAPAVTIDAATQGGAIDASALDLMPEASGGGARLRHAIGAAADVALRNARGAIVIGRAK